MKSGDSPSQDVKLPLHTLGMKKRLKRGGHLVRRRPAPPLIDSRVGPNGPGPHPAVVGYTEAPWAPANTYVNKHKWNVNETLMRNVSYSAK